MAFADGWKKQTQQGRGPALHNQLDPSHETPKDDEQVDWLDTSGAPQMPSDVVGDQYNIGIVPSGFYDATPQGGDFGMPAFPGFDQDEAQATRNVAHAQDFGSVAARSYVTPINRDGTYEVTDVTSPNLEGNPDEQNEIRYVTGVGTKYDEGNSRPNHRITRWRERQLDYHWFDVEMNPSQVRQATTVGVKGVPVNGNQMMSPYGSGEIIYNGDSFLAPVERRTPGPWDEALVETDEAMPGADFGLGMWGM